MPKAMILLDDEQMLAVMNRNLRFPGVVESIVSYDSFGDTCILVDLHPIVDYDTVFTFLSFMGKVYGEGYDISVVEDPEDYAVLENLLAAASHYDLFSFDWVDD